jgi:hypothetical protein
MCSNTTYPMHFGIDDRCSPDQKGAILQMANKDTWAGGAMTVVWIKVDGMATLAHVESVVLNGCLVRQQEQLSSDTAA